MFFSLPNTYGFFLLPITHDYSSLPNIYDDYWHPRGGMQAHLSSALEHPGGFTLTCPVLRFHQPLKSSIIRPQHRTFGFLHIKPPWILCNPRRFLVPETGLEPARPCGQGILSPLRLPFRHSGICAEIIKVFSTLCQLIYAVQVKSPRIINSKTFGYFLAFPSGFEPKAFRLGERKSVRLQHPSSARKRLLLLGF